MLWLLLLFRNNIPDPPSQRRHGARARRNTAKSSDTALAAAPSPSHRFAAGPFLSRKRGRGDFGQCACFYYYSAIISLIRPANASIANGFVMTCIPASILP